MKEISDFVIVTLVIATAIFFLAFTVTLGVHMAQLLIN